MKQKIFFLAALALVAASCAKNEIDAPAQEQGRTLTLAATLPGEPNDPETRLALQTDDATPHGLLLKWSEGDKLYLNFKHGGTFYRIDAPIVPGSISANGKTASFTITVPEEIPTGVPFDLYGVHQKVSTWGENDGGYFEKGQNNNVYVCENSEEECITLDKMGGAQNGIARPVLTFKQTNITAATIAPIAFEHRGWMMALHFKNTSEAEIDLPRKLEFRYRSASASSFIYNGYHGLETVKIDLDNDAVSASSSSWDSKACVYFTINKYSWLPLSGKKLGAGQTIVLYRWAISTPAIDKMYATGIISGADRDSQNSPDGKFLPAKTVEKGKVYHTYMTWDGTHLKITDSSFAPRP